MKIISLIVIYLTITVFADKFNLTAVVRDVWPCVSWKLGECGKNGVNVQCDSAKCMKSFESGIAVEQSIVQKQIGSNRKPRFNSAQTHSTIDDNGANWDYWWNNSPGHNIPIAVNLTMDNAVCEGTACNEFIYGYKNPNFFPINNQGFGNYQDNTNFHFTMEVHSRFQYRGDEVFKFTGDDDVWVFINGTLAVDLGGVHGEMSAEIKLWEATWLNLTVGKSASFDLFFTERHTTQSNFKMYTSLDLQCPYSDHCGQCVGDGQSCCTCADNNPCTIDACTATGDCVFTNRTCPGDPLNQCRRLWCDPTDPNGCKYDVVNCDDGLACTDDACDPKSGCSHTPRNCVLDNNACTVDLCSNSTGCYTQPLNCTDNDPCTVDRCDETYGCRRSPLNCTDANLCTVETCVTGVGCKSDPLICEDNDPCTLNLCDPKIGCQFTKIDCNDNNTCTIDTCVNGVCQNPSRSCNDNNPCTFDSCVNNYKDDPTSDGCVNKVNTCNDGDSCTSDSCGSNGVCSNTPIANCDKCKSRGPTLPAPNCTSSDPCKIGSCDPDSGNCTYVDYPCDDGNACTRDVCENVGGAPVCRNPIIPCSAATPCDPMTCDRKTGLCSTAPINCDDGNLCTIDQCVSERNSYNCTHETRSCPFADPCLPESCFGDKCQVVPVSCDDGNPCTDDSPVSDFNSMTCNCTHTLRCPTTDLCNPFTCDMTDGSCHNKTNDCDDSNVCTKDFCNSFNGTCYHEAIDCDDGDACTIEQCVHAAGGCVRTNRTCASDNKCETVTCDKYEGCVSEPIVFPYAGACTSQFCEPTLGLVVTNLTCKPADKCKCNPETNACECRGNFFEELPTSAKIAGGVIAGIVVGAVAFAAIAGFAGKKALDYVRVNKFDGAGITENPLYQNDGEKENPLFRAEDGMHDNL